MNEKTEFKLDSTTYALIAEYNAQIQTLAVQMNGALALVCRLNNLPGQWRLAPDGTKLMRVDVPQAEAQPDLTKRSTNGTRKK